MANYIVTSNADSGPGSLRRAVLEANTNPGLDNIIFEAANVRLNSSILITDSIEITGNGAVITQTGNNRLFNISDNDSNTLIDVTLNNFTLTGGRSEKSAGAINSLENLTISQVTVENNVSSENGSAIVNNGGNLVITDSSFRNNRFNEDNENAGGVIYLTNGTINIIDSNLEENEANLGVVSANNSQVTITNSSIKNNQGLGVFANQESIVDIDQSDISTNANGGIVLETSSQLTVTDTSITSNQAQSGAGVALTESEAEITDSIISRNIAEIEGGGLKVDGNSSLTTNITTIFGNNAPSGSGVFLSEDSSAALMNTTVEQNIGSDSELEGTNFTITQTEPLDPAAANLASSDIHRFYQYEKGFHLYTADAREIRVVQEQSESGALSYNYEAEQFTVLTDDRDTLTGEAIEGVQPVYRFFNTETGAHLYTMNEVEKGYIEDNLSNYNSEGIAYYAFEEQPENVETVPVFRMLNSQSGTHLFSVNQNEVDYIQDNLPNFSLENGDGIVFHVFEL